MWAIGGVQNRHIHGAVEKKGKLGLPFLFLIPHFSHPTTHATASHSIPSPAFIPLTPISSVHACIWTFSPNCEQFGAHHEKHSLVSLNNIPSHTGGTPSLPTNTSLWFYSHICTRTPLRLIGSMSAEKKQNDIRRMRTPLRTPLLSSSRSSGAAGTQHFSTSPST
jgi:hypothetical protein